MNAVIDRNKVIVSNETGDFVWSLRIPDPMDPNRWSLFVETRGEDGIVAVRDFFSGEVYVAMRNAPVEEADE